MSLGVTTNSVRSLTLPKEVNRIVTAEDKVFFELAHREQQNRPANENCIRGMV